MKEYYKSIDAEGQMFDFKSFYEKVANELPDNARVAEIGLNNGKSAIFLAEYLHNIGKPIDRFVGIDNCAYGGQDQRNEIIKNIVNAGVNIEFMEMSSLDASCKFPGNYFDMVFLDSSHTYAQTRAEIILWYERVKDGGVISGHDYLTHAEVKPAVDELIPQEYLTITETENGFGVWSFIKNWQWKLTI